MSYFDDASLVMIPSGYKTSKVYSVKPTSGDGDLTFTRSNDTATRVGPDGLIEKVRTNLLTYSNTFSNAVWSVVGTPTLTANYDTNPLTGANDAWRFVAAGMGDRLVQSFSGSFHNFSLYAKGTGIIRLRDSTDTFGINVTLTSSWQRISVHISAAFTNVQFLGGSGGCDATIYAAQLETGDIATDYIATTSAAVSVGPVANVPRLDYLNSSCPRLLLEPQRTNLVQFSEQLDNAWWAKLSASALANDAISPDGYTNADKIRPNSGVSFSILSGGIYTAGASSYIRSTGLTLTAASYTFSAFVKKGEYDYIQLRSGTSIDTTTNGSGLLVNLNNGTATTATGAYSIEDYGDGWYRVSHTFTATAATWYLNFWFWNSTSVTANGTDGVYVYGAQLEAGAYATSYIPTLGAAVTRGADACSKTGISSLIGQTEGTLFVEFNSAQLQSYTQRIFTVSDDTNNNVIGLQLTAANQITFYVENGGVNQAAITKGAPAITLGQNVKAAAAYKANDFVLYVNGVQVGTDTSGSVPATSVLRYANPTGNAPYIGKVAQTLLFKTRLTNAQLAELTTL